MSTFSGLYYATTTPRGIGAVSFRTLSLEEIKLHLYRHPPCSHTVVNKKTCKYFAQFFPFFFFLLLILFFFLYFYFLRRTSGKGIGNAFRWWRRRKESNKKENGRPQMESDFFEKRKKETGIYSWRNLNPFIRGGFIIIGADKMRWNWREIALSTVVIWLNPWMIGNHARALSRVLIEDRAHALRSMHGWLFGIL
jgi:hypothetical protein